MSSIKTEYYNTDHSQTTAIKAKWWLEDDKEMHAHVFGVLNRIKEAQNYRTNANLKYAQLYSNMEISGLQAGMYARSSQAGIVQSAVTFNVIKSCIDTAASKIAKNKVKPFFLTDGGNWELQRKSIRMNKYMEGLFDNIGDGEGDNRTLYGLARRCFVDAGVFGTGATKFYIDDDNVRAERVVIEEIVVDDTEGRYEQPRQLFQEKLMHRAILMDMFPKHKELIKSAQSGVKSDQVNLSSADMINVVEAWHLPSSKNTKDGCKAISIENCTLDVQEWTKDYFPFAFQRWSPRLLGFYGAGLAEELVGIQLEINKILRNIQLSQHLMAVPQVWLEYASKTVAKHINNEIGGIKYYAGREPKFFVPQAMSAEVYQHLENLYRKAYEITGISQMSANSQKPAGVDAAVAMRELQDIESERFQLVGLRYEDYFMDATRICQDLLNDIAETGANPAVRIKDGESSYVYKWKDVKLPKDSYTVRPFPTSLLSSTPAGKFQKVQEMMQAGFFDREESMELLDFPDIKAVVSLKVAQRRDLKRMIEKMVDEGEYVAPEPYINLEMARSLSQSYYLLGRAEGMPEDRLENLRRFMEDVEALINPPAPAPVPMALGAAPLAAAGMPPVGMDPLAMPVAPPVSDLLPIQPAVQGGMPL